MAADIIIRLFKVDDILIYAKDLFDNGNCIAWIHPSVEAEFIELNGPK